MSTVHRIAAILLVSSVPAISGCSNLSITTEVYDRDLDSVVEVATTLYRELAKVESDLKSELRSLSAAAWDRARVQAPDAFAGSGEFYADSYLLIVEQELDKMSFELRRADLQRRAKRLGAHSFGNEEESGILWRNRETIQAKLAELQFAYELFLADFSAAVEGIRTTNQTAIESGIYDSYVATPAAEEEALTEEQEADVDRLFGFLAAQGVTVPTTKDRTGIAGANALLDTQAKKLAAVPQASSLALLNEISRGLSEINEEVQEVGALPLGGPDVARIISAEDRYWAKYYNKVTGATYFGNAEIAIKMLDPGTYSMKGVVFDPSQVTKAVFDGVETAVTVAAAAAGVPVSLPGGGESSATSSTTEASASATGGSIKAAARALGRESSARLSSKALLFDQLVRDLAAAESGTYNHDEIAARLEELAKKIEIGKN